MVALIMVAAMTALHVPVHAQESTTPPRTSDHTLPDQAPPDQSTQPPPQTQPPPPDATAGSDDRRFAFHRIEGGVLRLDMRTGAVAACRPDGADWTCVPGREERAALDREIARLQRDNATLKNALLENGIRLPASMGPSPPAGTSGGEEEPVPRPPQTVPPTPTPGAPAQGGSVPSQIGHQLIDAVEKGWRRLVEVMTNLKRSLER